MINITVNALSLVCMTGIISWLRINKTAAVAATTTRLHCVSKNIPDILDSNLKNNYQILIIFDVIISDTTCH